MPPALGAPHAALVAPRAPVLSLRVLSLSGTRLCEFRVGLQAKISTVKQLIRYACGISPHEQRLVFAGKVWTDERTLAEAGAHAPGTMEVHCVRTAPSSIARSFVDADSSVHACAWDVVDSVLASEHGVSERCRPLGAEALGNVAGAIHPQHRAEVITWLVEAFTMLHFDREVLHSVVLTIDRYLSSRPAPMPPGSVLGLLLAAICIEMKLVGARDFLEGHWQRVVLHIANGHADLSTILQMELELLQALSFRVGVPTPASFLRQLWATHELGQAAGVADLALFLLLLCLFQPDIAYRHPHCLLAAGALSAALRVLEGTDRPTHACDLERSRVLETLAVYGCAVDAEAELLRCEAAVLELWVLQHGAQSESYRKVLLFDRGLPLADLAERAAAALERSRGMPERTRTVERI